MCRCYHLFIISICLWVVSVFLFSCENKSRGGDVLNSQLPSAFGSVNSINFISDSIIWKGPIGDSARAYFERYYPILPQREPSMNVRFFTPRNLNDRPIRKELSNFVVLTDLSDEESPTTDMTKRDLKKSVRDSLNMIVARNKWARDQMLVYINGKDESSLMEQLKKYKEYIEEQVHEHQKIILEKEVYSAELNPILQNRIRDSFGINIRIPEYYQVAVQEPAFMWIRGESEYVSRNLMFYKLPYRHADQLTPKYMKELRNELGLKITTTIDSTFMLINDVDLPIEFSTTAIDDQYAAVLKGIWEIENDFLGGPFTSYMIQTPDRKELVFIDAFVHAPSKPKRDLMEKLKYIVGTTNFVIKESHNN